MLNSTAFGAGAYARGKFFVIGGFDGRHASSVVQALGTPY
jgi:hypothetical protein